MLLVRIGVDVPRAEQLLREAFVVAASQRWGCKRPTQSEIASLTGLSRVEVRRIEREVICDRTGASTRRLNRIDRLVNAWRTNRAYLDRRGRARPLGTNGPKSEFADLVRKHGGDVTARTLIGQLTKLGIAKVSKDQISLLAQGDVRNSDLLAARADLRWLADSLEEIALESGKRSYSTIKMVLPMRERKTAQMFRRTALRSIETTLRAIEELAQRQPIRTTLRSDTKNRILIHVSIAAEAPDKQR